MGVPTSEVGYTPAMPRREDHEVHKDMWWHWTKKKYFSRRHIRVNTAKDYTVYQRLPVQKKNELLMMSSLKLETCRVKDD